MAESLADRKRRARRILDGLARMYPDARIELESSTPLELLVATILSAQCTDQRVNQVTAGLFPKYRTARDWAAIPPARLEREIHSTGFYRAKARSILGMARALVERHGGEVPRTLDELTELPGVGRKTANVVLGNAFGIPALAVDTHVTRVSQRLGLTRATDAGEDPRRSRAPSSRRTGSPRPAISSSGMVGGPVRRGPPSARNAGSARSAPGPGRRRRRRRSRRSRAAPIGGERYERVDRFGTGP